MGLTIAASMAMAQTPDYANIGRRPSQEDMQAWDIAIGTEGKELPPGKGTAKEGEAVYARKCAVCHGADLNGAHIPGSPVGSPKRPLIGGMDKIRTPEPVRTVGAFWPFATTVWDYIYRAMPFGQEGSLTPAEVYSVTAFILYKNGIIQENDVLDAKSLPKVKMPNRDGFLPARFEDIADLQKRGCRLGQCPESNSK